MSALDIVRGHAGEQIQRKDDFPNRGMPSVAEEAGQPIIELSSLHDLVKQRSTMLLRHAPNVDEAVTVLGKALESKVCQRRHTLRWRQGNAAEW